MNIDHSKCVTLSVSTTLIILQPYKKNDVGYVDTFYISYQKSCLPKTSSHETSGCHRGGYVLRYVAQDGSKQKG